MTKAKEASYTDRYQATGTSCPDPENCCDTCEGMGCVPVGKNETEEPYKNLWLAAEKKKKTDDGWHFVKCPACKGSRVRVETSNEAD